MLQGLVYKNCIYFHNRYESFNCHQYFHYIPQPVCQLDLFYNFHSLNILSRTSHDLSHSHSQLLGSQVNLLQHIPLPINSLHLHLHLLLFQSCLLLQTLASTRTHKISETNSSFYVKWRATGKVQFLFLKSFLLVLTKLSFLRGDWTLSYHSMKFRQFPDIS